MRRVVWHIATLCHRPESGIQPVVSDYATSALSRWAVAILNHQPESRIACVRTPALPLFGPDIL